MRSPFDPPEDWRGLCRQLFVGYGACREPRGHRGMCHTGSVGCMVEFKTRRVAVAADGKLKSGDYHGYTLEPVPPKMLAREVARLLSVADGEIDALRKRAATLRRVARTPKKYAADRVWEKWP